ncbi:MAG: hypothetical protein K2L12_08475, partial [Clostridia bacterium]|nr:hypothetical protein [Clostridia bacterium]
MNVLIVVNAYIKNKSQILQAERIAYELQNLDVECCITKNFNLASINNGRVKYRDFDKCVFLDKDKAAARLLEKNGKRLINSAYAIETCDDKMLTYIALADNEIAMPDTYYAPLCYYSNAEVSNDYLNTVSHNLGFPLVAKLCYGS